MIIAKYRLGCIYRDKLNDRKHKYSKYDSNINLKLQKIYIKLIFVNVGYDALICFISKCKFIILLDKSTIVQYITKLTNTNIFSSLSANKPINILSLFRVH